jgi:hypothetical protein
MMANDFMGMFTTPQEIRQKQLDAERAAYDKAMLSGDAFMQGQAMGRRIGGSVGGMMGMTSTEEAKAQNIKNLFDETVAMRDGEFNLDTSDNLAYFAKKLNDLGYTAEAVKVLEKRDSVLDRERRIAAEEETKAQGVKPRVEERTVPVIRTYKGKPVLDENDKPIYDLEKVKVYFDWNATTKKWEERGSNQGTGTGTGAEGAKFHNVDSFNAALRSKYGY